MDTRNQDILDDAVAAWKTTERPETLSDGARSYLFDEVRSIGSGRDNAYVPAVSRAWRWAFLGALPVVGMAAVLILAGGQHAAQSAKLTASKVDGQVVFTLANGKTGHMVYRSTRPDEFERSSGVKMAGNRYSDEATGGPNLVFYRID